MPVGGVNHHPPSLESTFGSPPHSQTREIQPGLYVARTGITGKVRYAEACLAALERVPEGQGRDRCKSVSLKLFGLCKAGLLDPEAVTARIKRVMVDRGWREGDPNGCTPAELDRLLSWAWDHA
jgi:hypothetical protein